jgi:hypothetical protein
VVQVLMAAGADVSAGTPSAYDTARFFDNVTMLALVHLDTGLPNSPPGGGRQRT